MRTGSDALKQSIELAVAAEALGADGAYFPRATVSRIGMTGKFLPYKYYGATGNALAVGLKEE